MTGILADHNLEGYVRALVGRMSRPPWDEFWAALAIRAFEFPDLGLAPTAPDGEVWRLCQARGLVLITDNRNRDGPDALDAVIAGDTTGTALPVVTVGDTRTLRDSRAYAERAVEKLLDYLLNIDSYRGAGRLYIP